MVEVRRLAFVVSMVGLLAAARPVEAQPPTALLPFDGPGADAARRLVQTALEEAGTVAPIALDRIDVAAARTGAGSSSEVGLAAVARALGARLLIQGTIDGAGRRRAITLVARDATGQFMSTASATGTRMQSLRAAVSELLETSVPFLPAPRVEAATPAPTVVEAPPRDEVEQPSAPRGGEAAPSIAPDRRAPLLALQLGLVPRSRDADVLFTDGEHARYAAWYAEVGARAELRPLAGDPGLARGLFVRGSFGHAVGLVTRVESSGAEVPTTFFRGDGALGYVAPVGDIVEVGGEIGAGVDTFSLGVNPLLEGAEYAFVRPGLRLRLRLVRELVVLDVAGGVRPVLSRGDFQRYGIGGDTLGVDVGGALGGSVSFGGPVGLSWAIDATWVGYDASFSGMATSSTPGKHASDGGVRLGLWLGIAVE